MKNNLDDEIDGLFQLPLAEFTSARNTLAARLKKEGRPNDADRVKLLAKPSISAWTVNQLYWNHRKAFDQLIATGKRLRPAQKLRLAGKVAGMRDSLDARREALVHLSELATELLQDAGSNPSPDTLRRVTTTLEAMSAHGLLSDGPTPGRLTQDLDPPSFDSLAAWMSSAGAIEDDESEPIAPSRKSSTAANVKRLEEVRRAKIADAKISLQDAKKSLSDARARAQSLESTQKKANAEVKEAEKHRREVEQLLEKATEASEAAARRARDVAEELQEVAKTVDDAKRAVDAATKDLESLLRGSPV
jgi:DNA repair exonuclease SbcCD ATPase subunit